jgi:multiple sugar transport system substrate-binding protein
MRKLLATLAVAVTATAALAGCSTSSSSTDSNGHIDLTFWHGYTEADGKVLDGIVDDYNKSQDKVTIKTQVKTWDVIDDTLLTALSANKGPQIVAMPAERLPVYASKKALVNLDDFYADDKNAAEISDQAAAMETVDGAKYGVPTGFVPLSVFYNKALFEAAGVTEFPETWDEWVDAAKKLTVDQDGDGTPEQYGLALADHATVGNGVWPSLFAGNGGEIVDDSKSVIDSPENVETLEYWSKALNDDKISPTGLDGVATDKLFSSGKAAMTIGGPWMASVSTENKIDYGIAAIPAGPVAQASACRWPSRLRPRPRNRRPLRTSSPTSSRRMLPPNGRSARAGRPCAPMSRPRTSRPTPSSPRSPTSRRPPRRFCRVSSTARMS